MFHDGEEVGPVCYLHWSGCVVFPTIERLRTLMADRNGDVSYATARFLGLCCYRLPGSTSIGCWNGPESLHQARISDPESHGDAGVLLVNCKDWTVHARDGYAVDQVEKYKADTPGWSVPPEEVEFADSFQDMDAMIAEAHKK
jgi:hypothetical protein